MKVSAAVLCAGQACVSHSCVENVTAEVSAEAGRKRSCVRVWTGVRRKALSDGQPDG
jgi:hypothetical protein